MLFPAYLKPRVHNKKTEYISDQIFFKMMLSEQDLLQAFSTMSEEKRKNFFGKIQQGNTVGNINTTGETTRTRRRPVRTCTLTYKERGCIQYMTSTYTI